MPAPDDMPVNALAGVLAARSGGNTHTNKRKVRLMAQALVRSAEALRLYEPLPYQDAFHRCTAKKCVIQKGNRTGGTLANMVEVARAVTGQDPYGKYPKRDGRAVVLGYGEPHIGRVFFAKLFKPGAFSIIRDLKTNEWRVARQWPAAQGGDLERWEERKPAPPLIPARYIDGKISWTKKNLRVFDLVRFTTGWELHAMNSAGDPGQAQGFSVNLYAIDEDLATSGWYEESIGRTADCGGLTRWSAIPHARNDDLMQLLDFAEKEAEKPKPQAVIIRASILDNPHQDQVSRNADVEAWRAMGDDVFRKRVMGEMNIDSVLMYPTFNRRVHDVMTEHPEDSQATKILRASNGIPPADWTLFLSLDPGHTVCATVFVAVPPPELGDQMFAFDELYIPQCHAPMWGEAVEQKIRDRMYQRFYIDMHGGSIRSTAGGAQPVDAYVAELTNRGLQSEETKSSFMAGFDEVAKREERMRTHLATLHDGRPKLMFVVGNCPNLVREMEKFRKMTVKVGNRDMPTDKGNRRNNTHAIEALEQLVAYELPYVKPKPKAMQVNFFDRFIQWRDSRRQARQSPLGGDSISLGPVGVTS